MKYLVYGTIRLNFSVELEAENVDDAEQRAISRAEDGSVNLAEPVGEAEIDEVKSLEK